MSDYKSALNFLYSLKDFGVKLGLENIKSLLKFLGNPEKRFTSIHIAGTNGKGSTASFIASILKEAGFKVALYTSPHLVDFTERIRINGKPVDRETIARYTSEIKDKVENLRATFFEATTAIAFKYFADENVDFAVIETGLGGRLDSTNVIKPAVSVITDVSYDHMNVLGSSIEKIAFEKGGIIKPGVPCLTGCETKEALDVLEKIALQNNAELVNINTKAKFQIENLTKRSVSVKLETEKHRYGKLEIGLAGKFQIKNAIMATLTYEKLSEIGYFKHKAGAIGLGLKNVVKNSGIRARFELFKEKPDIVIDVAHNHPAVKRIVQELEIFDRKTTYVLFGVMSDKEYEKMISEISKIADFAVGVKPKIDRALDSEVISAVFRSNGVDSIAIGDSVEAFNYLLDKADEDDLILVIGSHYLAGEVIASLEGEKIEFVI